MAEKKEKKKKERSQGAGTRILLYFVLVGGIALMLYPFVSNYIFDHRKDSQVSVIESQTRDLDEEARQREFKLAQKYNKALVSEHVQLTDPFKLKKKKTQSFDYMKLLNFQNDGVMGIVKIPCINVELPVYHGTGETELENGAGHLEGTSLPVGGRNTHAVITGHTGLNKAKLFTDLVQMEKGDYFIVKVLNRKLAYQVDQIKVVLPEQTKDLEIFKNKDLCTLVTCTPYGINSHRLFVRGHRVPYDPSMENEGNALETIKKSEWMRQYTKAMLLSLLVIILLIVASKVYDTKKSKKKKKQQETDV